MSVKLQIEQTKQTILKNKYEFIQIQLQQIIKRIQNIKIHNIQLKNQINLLKTQSGKSVTYRDQKIQGNKQNKCVNKNKLIQVTSANTYRTQNLSLTTHQKYIKKKCQNFGNYHHLQIKQFQEKLEKQLKNKQLFLNQLENQIKILKSIWEEQHRQSFQPKNFQLDKSINSFNDIFSSSKNKQQYQNIQKPTKYICKSKSKLISMQPLNFQNKFQACQNNKLSRQNSLNNSIFINQSCLGIKNIGNKSYANNNCNNSVDARRKTMSVNLTSGINQMSGFVFGKKSMQKTFNKQDNMPKRFYQNKDTDTNAPMLNERRVSESLFSASTSFANNEKIPSKTLMKSSMNTLNNSLSRSNSNRTYISNTNKSFIMKKTQASKSYAKIVTKLQCRGCLIQFKPNQYYSHVQQCREYLKLQLLDQKQQIQDQISNNNNYFHID